MKNTSVLSAFAKVLLFLFLCQQALSAGAVPTSVPSGQPTCIPSGKPSGQPSCVPSGQPTCIPSGKPSGQPTCSPTCLPSGQPSGAPSGQPTSVPSARPSIPAFDFRTRWEGGTNDTVKGVFHTFYVPDATIETLLRVEIYETDFDDLENEYAKTRINGVYIDSPCSSGVRHGNKFYACFRDLSVFDLISNGVLNVLVTAEYDVNNYPHNGYLLYVRMSLTDMPYPTGQPTTLPTSIPSGEPTGQPTGEPTGQPSSQPTCVPTSIPTARPTSLPTSCPSSQPSRAPSGQPTGQPSSSPSYSPPTSMPTTPASSWLEVWQGGNATWHSRHTWNGHLIPTASSSVIMDVGRNVTITISENVTVENFNMTGGNLLILSGVALTVSNQFVFNGGVITGEYISYEAEGVQAPRAVLNVDSISKFNAGTNVKLLQFINVVCGGVVTWDAGNVVLASSTINIEAGVTFTIDTSSSMDSASQMTLKSDSSYYYFNAYPAMQLSTIADLDLTMPLLGAIYDIYLPFGVEGNGNSTSYSGTNGIYGSFIAHKLGREAVDYYLNNIYNASSIAMYDEVVDSVATPNDCAELCLDRAWCVSFDYFVGVAACNLSPFRMYDVGGLSARGEDGVADDVIHFDKPMEQQLYFYKRSDTSMDRFSSRAVEDPRVTLAFSDYPALAYVKNYGTIYVKDGDLTRFALDERTAYNNFTYDTPVQLLDDAFSANPSEINNHGSIIIEGGGRVAFDVVVNGFAGSEFIVNSGVATFTQENMFAPSSSLYLCSNATVDISGIRSHVTTFQDGSQIASADAMKCSGDAAGSNIIVSKGQVIVSTGHISGLLAFTFMGDSYSIFNSHSLVLSEVESFSVLNSAFVYLVNKHSTDVELVDDGFMHIDSDAVLFVRNFSLSTSGSVISSSVTIDGTLTATGLGYYGSEGPLPGLSDALSASGGSYGGRGGTGHVDSSNYDSKAF